MSNRPVDPYVTVDYLDSVYSLTGKYKRLNYRLLGFPHLQRVLDVGCGPGTDTIPMAKMLGPAGQVIGIDSSLQMLAEAERRSWRLGLQRQIRHLCADAEALPFTSNYFDACYSERLFIHLSSPEQVLAEIVRVTRPGGRIAVVDPDWGTVSVDTPEVDLERRLARYYAEGDLKNGFSGRTLYRLFKRQGFDSLEVRIQPMYTTDLAAARHVARLDLFERYAVEAGVITPQELDRWQVSLETAQRAGEFFASLNRVLVVGMKPIR